MAKRNGGIIGKANNPTSSVAKGMWRLQDQFSAIKNGNWPNPVNASGGTITEVTDGGVLYTVHTFTSTGTFTVTYGGTIQYLVVGGGGAGG